LRLPDRVKKEQANCRSVRRELGGSNEADVGMNMQILTKPRSIQNLFSTRHQE